MFLKDLANQLSENKLYNHVINLEPDKITLYKSLYNLSKTELTTLQDYIDTNLLNDFIKSFKSSVEASILFIKKKDSILRLCVDYRDLNLVIIKNCYSLSLIDESLNHLKQVKIFIKLDLMLVYYHIHVTTELLKYRSETDYMS